MTTLPQLITFSLLPSISNITKALLVLDDIANIIILLFLPPSTLHPISQNNNTIEQRAPSSTLQVLKDDVDPFNVNV